MRIQKLRFENTQSKLSPADKIQLCVGLLAVM